MKKHNDRLVSCISIILTCHAKRIHNAGYQKNMGLIISGLLIISNEVKKGNKDQQEIKTRLTNERKRNAEYVTRIIATALHNSTVSQTPSKTVTVMTGSIEKPKVAKRKKKR